MTLSVMLIPDVVMLGVPFFHFYAECYYAACRYAECHGANNVSQSLPIEI
jgi:hypothetical protein